MAFVASTEKTHPVTFVHQGSGTVRSHPVRLRFLRGLRARTFRSATPSRAMRPARPTGRGGDMSRSGIVLEHPAWRVLYSVNTHYVVAYIGHDL